jgi:two-component system C4-dicarboxylate transport sensor histidine kinase DctB
MRVYLSEGQARAEATMNLTASSLNGWIRRFEMVPRLLADDEALRQLVLEPGAPDMAERVSTANRWLDERNALLESSEIYVIGLDGTTIAASNFASPDSFVGQNFTYRPYFTEARAGRTGRFFGLGTTSGLRGYYFAGPIHDEWGAVAGIIAVKVGIDHLEQDWSAGVERVIVTDPEGIVFMSSEPDWRYAAFEPLTPERLARTEASRRYADVVPREARAERTAVGDVNLVAVTALSGHVDEYVEVRRYMPSAGMEPISSRRIVPPRACSKRPKRGRIAPGKAPASWPKSSLSTVWAGSAAQLIATKGRFARVDRS